MVLTLAVGVGAFAAVSSFVLGVLLDPLPYPRAADLVVLASRFDAVEINDVSWLDARDWRSHLTAVEELAIALTWDSVSLGAEAEGSHAASRVRAEYVSPSYFELLGAAVAVGRTFTEAEDAPPAGAPVLVLSHGLWQQRFGGDPAILGRQVVVDGRASTVVGVLAQGSHPLSGEAQLWLPSTQIAAGKGPVYLEDRSLRVFTVLARLQEGATPPQAQAELAELTRSLEELHPGSNRGYGGSVVRLSDWVYRQVPGLSEPRRTLLWLGLAALVLLILAGANLAHLFSLRLLDRGAELGVRQALGASPVELLWPLLLEALLLGLPGAAAAHGLAWLGVRGVLASEALGLPPWVEVGPGLVVGALALALALGLSSGLTLLAWARMGRRPQAAIATSGRRGGAALVFLQATSAVVLVFAAGLVLASTRRLHETGLGFATERLLTFEVALSTPGYDERPARALVARRLREEVAALPGVEVAGLWGAALPGVGGGYLELVPEGEPVSGALPGSPAREAVRGINHHVSAGALAALGIPLLRGRDLAATDGPDDPIVAVLGAHLAERLFPGREALGGRFRLGTASEAPRAEVVGIAADVLHGPRLGAAEPLDFYLHYDQRPVRNLGLFVLGDVPVSNLEPWARESLRRIDADLPAFAFTAARSRLRQEEAPARLAAFLAASSAAVALGLAAIGLYGVLAFQLERRRKTLALHRVLGATSAAVVRRALAPLLSWVFAGLVAGTFLSWIGGRALALVLYRADAGDPFFFTLAIAILLLVLGVASWFPIRRLAGSELGPLLRLP